MPRIPMPGPLNLSDFASEDDYEAAMVAGWQEYADKYFEKRARYLLVMFEKQDIDYWSTLIDKICAVGWEVKEWDVSDGDWYGNFRINFNNREMNSRLHANGITASAINVDALRQRAEMVRAEREASVAQSAPPLPSF